MSSSCGACYDRWITETLEPAARDAKAVGVCQRLLLTAIKFICDAGFAYDVSTEAAQAVLGDLDAIIPTAFRIFPFEAFSRRFWWNFRGSARRQHLQRR